MPQDQVSEIKQKVDIVTLIAEHINVQKAGRNYKALCPFHSEKTPSFVISPELQIYRCFGCGESGDAFTFLEKYEGMDFYEALKFLADRAGVKLTPRSGAASNQKERLYEVNALAAKFYQYLLLNHPIGQNALIYLTRDRGLTKKTINLFGIGFAPPLESSLTKFLVNKKKFKVNEVIEAGLAVKSQRGIIDRFRGRVIFPLFDHRGNAVGLAGRILPQYEKKDVGKYINSPETPVYHKGSLLYALNLTRGDIKKEGIAVVVEGELDAISSLQSGVKNVVAIKGTALTEDQIRLLSRLAKEVVLALDSDLAGESAALRGVLKAFELGVEVRVARLGKFKDPDEAARADPAAFQKSLTRAIPIWDFLIDSSIAKVDIASGSGKAKVSRELTPLLAQIPDQIVRDHYINLLAKKLAVDPASVESEVSKKGKPQVAQGESQAAPTKSRREILEERLLGLMMATHQFGELKDPALILAIRSLFARKVLEFLKKYLAKHKKFAVQDFSQSLPKELFEGVANLFLFAEGESTKEAAGHEIEALKKEILILDTKDRLTALSSQIATFEKEGKDKSLHTAKTEFASLSKSLSLLEENG